MESLKQKCPECESPMAWRESLGVWHCNKCEMDWSTVMVNLCTKVRNAALREAAGVEATEKLKEERNKAAMQERQKYLPQLATLQKQCEDLRHARDSRKAASECEHQDKLTVLARAEKAEAEVAAIRQGIKEAEGVTGDVDDVLDLVGTFIDHHKAKEDQLTQLQQDVRPLLRALANGDHESQMSPQLLALETFLAKHPELKQ